MLMAAPYSGGAASDWSADEEQQLQKLMAKRQQKSVPQHQAGGSWYQVEGFGAGLRPGYPPGAGGGGPPSTYYVEGSGGGFKMPGN
jgi:hypothetical protein